MITSSTPMLPEMTSGSIGWKTMQFSRLTRPSSTSPQRISALSAFSSVSAV